MPSLLLKDRVHNEGTRLLINGTNGAGITWRHLAQFRPIGAFVNISVVNAIGCDAVADSNVHVFARFPLTALCLGDTKITNGALSKLAPLGRTLKELCLRGTSITDEGLTVEWAQQFPNLSSLVVPAGVSYSRITALHEAFPNLDVGR